MSIERLESLTPDQEAMLPKYRDRWLAIGLQHGKELPSTERMLELFSSAYEKGDQPVPTTIVTVRSPFEGAIAASLLAPDSVTSLTPAEVPAFLEKVRRLAASKLSSDIRKGIQEQLSNACYGAHDANWLGFYNFFLEQTHLTPLVQPLVPLMTIAAAGIGWFWPFESVVVVSPVPAELHMWNERLHNPDGPAISYTDGFSIYAMNGVIFRETNLLKFFSQSADEIDVGEVLAIENVEQRAELLKKVGIERAFRKLNPTLLDRKVVNPGGEYHLYEVRLRPDSPRIYLYMENPSVPGEKHLEAVHPTCKTVEQALQWRNWGAVTIAGSDYKAPMVLT